MKNNRGFTLLELSIVLLIMGFLTTTSITMTRGFINYQKHKETKERIQTIAFSINNYVLKNKKLPCPTSISKNYKTDSSLSDCSLSEKNGFLIGTIPSDTLEIRKDILADAWGNKFVYIVSSDLTDSDFFYSNQKTTNLINDKFAFSIISMGPDKANSYSYSATSVKNKDISVDDYANSYNGFEKNLIFNDVDDIILIKTKEDLTHELYIKDLTCYIKENDIRSKIELNCGSSYFSNTISTVLQYKEKKISSEENYTKKQITMPDDTTKEIYTELKQCIIECSDYGNPIVYLRTTDI